MKDYLLISQLFIFSILFNTFVVGQQIPDENKNAYTFPDDWLGVWSGTLEIYNQTGLVQKIPMKAEHLVTDTTGVYIWSLVYGEDTIKGRRNYFLKTVDAEKGHYVVDEKNGIFLDSYVIGNKLISNFEVSGNHLVSTYTLEREKILFEIFVSDNKSIRVSGGNLHHDEEIPEVFSFRSKVYQKAILYKK
ncbi:MAG: hypothetical protein IPM42_06990 [Saprospiraceae bacterium]|nr:hypothetical protein [Saprospiraceae bacterium]